MSTKFSCHFYLVIIIYLVINLSGNYSAGLNSSFKKLRAWHPVPSLHANRWGYNGNGDRFILLGSKITMDGDCNHEIKRCLLLGRKAMTNLDSVLKSRDITLLTNVWIVKAMFFLVVM